MSFVKFENVYKRYKMGEITINAADGVSFEIEKGEFAVIVGASGADCSGTFGQDLINNLSCIIKVFFSLLADFVILS